MEQEKEENKEQNMEQEKEENKEQNMEQKKQVKYSNKWYAYFYLSDVTIQFFEGN